MNRRTLLHAAAIALGTTAILAASGAVAQDKKWTVGFSQATTIEPWRAQFNKDIIAEAAKQFTAQPAKNTAATRCACCCLCCAADAATSDAHAEQDPIARGCGHHCDDHVFKCVDDRLAEFLEVPQARSDEFTEGTRQIVNHGD